jgi:Baseplate J-like protein
MTDEKIIYLGPEEELTSVSERLEKTNAGHITLVIPPQTQLRSLVGWRLLHARMRKLGKDVLVISSERQIRSVAKAAGFRVADSQESSPSARTRPSSHPSHSGTGGKTPQRSRNLPGRGSPENRAQRQRQQPNQPRVAADDRQQMQQTRRETSSGADTGTASSTYGIQDAQFRSPMDLHIDTSPSIRPLVPGRVDDELDTLTADFYRAQSIREAAQGMDAGTVSPAPGTREPSSGIARQESKTSLPAGNEDDPFVYMEDLQPASLPEQRGSTRIEDIESGISDIADVPTDELEYKIEDMGDEGAVFLQQDFSPHPWSEPAVEEPGRVEMPRVSDAPPRNSRMGKWPLQGIDDPEVLPPVPEQPTQITPSPSAVVRSPAMPTPSTVGNRGPQPIIQPPARSVSTTAASPKTKKPAKASRPATPPPTSKRASLTPGRRNSRIAAISVSVVILVLAALAFIIFGSNATVTIIVPTQKSAPLNLQYVASINPAQNTIPSQVLTYPASVSETGTATGVTQQGDTPATGTVIFTNKGRQPVDIPTGTVIQTGGAAAVQFMTTVDVLVLPASTNGYTPPPVKVEAQSPGNSGNVLANAITVVPATSLKSIAAWQRPKVLTSSVILTVTNPDATSGGGSANVPQVTSSDASALAKALHPSLQKQIASWLAKEVQQGDVRGKLLPDVVDSPTPLPEEILTTTPKVGQISLAGGKFTGILSVSVKILVIRAATIQTVSQKQLNANAMKMKPAFVLVTQRPVNISIKKVTPSADGTMLSVSWTAMGQIMQQVSAQRISSLVAGQGVDQATKDIMSKAGITGVTVPPIDVFPPFLSIMPLRAEQIHVVVQPGPEKGTPNG